MTERERINLYNDLCDFKSDLQAVYFPPQTKQIDIITRAISYVRGTQAKWVHTPQSEHEYAPNGALLRTSHCTCSSCGFADGRSDFRICPNCGARMQK